MHIRIVNLRVERKTCRVDKKYDNEIKIEDSWYDKKLSDLSYKSLLSWEINDENICRFFSNFK